MSPTMSLAMSPFNEMHIIYSSLFTETVAKNNYIQKKIYATT